MGENRLFFIIKIEFGKGLSQIQMDIEETSDGTDVFPVSVEKVSVNFFLLDGERDDFPAEVLEIRPLQ